MNEFKGWDKTYSNTSSKTVYCLFQDTGDLWAVYKTQEAAERELAVLNKKDWHIVDYEVQA
tara:strand:- start:97 stop:279 length:183 start_codon:yes stop_codon:yes gene_type:complete